MHSEASHPTQIEKIVSRLLLAEERMQRGGGRGEVSRDIPNGTLEWSLRVTSLTFR